MQHDDGGMWYTSICNKRRTCLAKYYLYKNWKQSVQHGYLKMQDMIYVYDLFLMTTKTVVRIALIVANNW